MLNKKVTWKDGAKCAAMITINLDAQYFGKIYYPEMNVNEGECIMLGRPGIYEYLPKVLDVLDEYNVKATFFVPGAVAREYEIAVKDIIDRGHEIGCHGNYHENLALLTAEEQEAALAEATETLKSLTGTQPEGFRMPEGEISRETLAIVKKLGYTYSSSMGDDDVPYVDENGLVELPIHWELFDLPYFIFTWEPQMPQGHSRAASMKDVLENWFIELEGAKRFGTLFNLQLDPTTAGEQGRIFMLEEMLKVIKADSSIWLTTGKELADWYRGN